MNICIIPARGGSKRIPRKNMRLFRGKPMIAWSIKAAFDSKCFDRVIVSTDDEEISNIARSHQADVPFKRPNQLANDITGTKEVVIHAIKWLRQQGINYDAICCPLCNSSICSAQGFAAGAQTNEKF